MTQIKTRKVTASNMNTPVTLQQKVRLNEAWVWRDIVPLMYCEFQSKVRSNVNTGMMTIGAWQHDIYTRFMVVLAPGQRLYNAVENKYYYIQTVGDVEHLRQWSNLTAYEVNFDPAMTLDITRPNNAKGAYRESTESFDAIASGVPALFADPNATALSIYASRIGELETYAVGVPLDTSVRPGDLLTVSATGETFRVHAVRSPISFASILTLLVGKVV